MDKHLVSSVRLASSPMQEHNKHQTFASPAKQAHIRPMEEYKRRRDKQRRHTQDRVKARGRLRKSRALQKVEVFRLLDDDVLDHLVDEMEYEYYVKGQAIMHQGDIADSLYVIINGRCNVYVQHVFKNRSFVSENATTHHYQNLGVKVGSLSDFDVFGEASLLGASQGGGGLPRRSATVIVDSNKVQLLKLQHCVFETLADSLKFGDKIQRVFMRVRSVGKFRMKDSRSKILLSKNKSLESEVANKSDVGKTSDENMSGQVISPSKIIDEKVVVDTSNNLTARQRLGPQRGKSFLSQTPAPPPHHPPPPPSKQPDSDKPINKTGGETRDSRIVFTGKQGAHRMIPLSENSQQHSQRQHANQKLMKNSSSKPHFGTLNQEASFNQPTHNSESYEHKNGLEEKSKQVKVANELALPRLQYVPTVKYSLTHTGDDDQAGEWL